MSLSGEVARANHRATELERTVADLAARVEALESAGAGSAKADTKSSKKPDDE